MIHMSSPSRNGRLCVGNAVEIGRIGERAEAQAERWNFAMLEQERQVASIGAARPLDLERRGRSSGAFRFSIGG